MNNLGQVFIVSIFVKHNTFYFAYNFLFIYMVGWLIPKPGFIGVKKKSK